MFGEVGKMLVTAREKLGCPCSRGHEDGRKPAGTIDRKVRGPTLRETAASSLLGGCDDGRQAARPPPSNGRRIRPFPYASAEAEFCGDGFSPYHPRDPRPLDSGKNGLTLAADGIIIVASHGDCCGNV